MGHSLTACNPVQGQFTTMLSQSGLGIHSSLETKKIDQPLWGQGARRKWIHRFWVAPSHLCYRHFYLGTLNALTWGVVRLK